MAAASGHPPSHRANCRELFPLLHVVTRSHIAGVGWIMVAPLVTFVVFLAACGQRRNGRRERYRLV